MLVKCMRMVKVVTVAKHLDFGQKVVHGFWPKSENFDFGKKGYHMKGHLKRNRMTQISAS